MSIEVVQNIITIILLVSGVFFMVVSAVGLIRFPDFYTRAHAVGKSDTLGLMLCLAGLAVYNGLEISTIKIIVILLFIMIANSTATHALVKAALHSGLPFWTRANGKTPRSEVDAE